MPRYKAIVAYDGTNYCGFQSQENGYTVQAEIEKTLQKLNNGQKVTIHGSGRTDSGVHAWGQVIHFDYPERDAEKLRHALDTQSAPDIAIRSVEKVRGDFHARYHAVEKTYHYHLDIGKPRTPFKRFYSAHYRHPIDLGKMQEAIQHVIGTYDYSAFCATGTAVENKVRTIHEASITEVATNELLFVFRGDGFLYKMVRILVGTLIKIGSGQIDPKEMPAIIASLDRHQAGPTAHPEGLYLMEVKYPAGCERDTE